MPKDRSCRNRRNAYLYRFKKNYCLVWIAVDRYGKKFINCNLGSKGIKTDELLWEKIKDKEIGKIATDYRKAYERFILKNKHVQSKAETFTIESYNSLFRHFLTRMRRKSKRYTNLNNS